MFRALRRDRPWQGLAAGLTFFALAVLLRWLLGETAMGFGPMLFLPAILLAGLFGGLRIGLGLTVICVLLSWIWFFPPYGTFDLDRYGVAAMVIFVLTATLELYIIQSLNVAINDLSAAHERVNTLFRELQHRVANNLQFVAGVLLREKKGVEKGSAGALALDAALGRLSLMARVHRRLHDPAAIDLPIGKYLEDFCTDLIKASDTPDIRLTVEAQSPHLGLEALMTLSLIVAEVVTNSLKHAFVKQTDGCIAITLTIENHVCTLDIADNGCGIPKNLAKAKRRGLGQSILKNLATQLNGTLSYERGAGTTLRLVFPE
jgi:two-component sensor histidine kinase